MTEAPLIVQADGAVLLETQHPQYEVARERLACFAELEKSPEYVHFYRITPISIWNAAALGEKGTSGCDSGRWRRYGFQGGTRSWGGGLRLGPAVGRCGLWTWLPRRAGACQGAQPGGALTQQVAQQVA